MGARSHLLALLLAFVSAPTLSVAAPAPQDSAVIYVVRRGWHIDIGFAAADLQPPLASLAAEFPGVRYLLFGFGDQRYLMAKDRNAPVLLAALWPGRGLILATGLTAPPPDAFGESQVIALAVTARQARDAQAFVWQSLAGGRKDSADSPVEHYARGPYEGSLYFIAKPQYSAFHTCNTWAAEALEAAALPIHVVGVVFAGQLWVQVRRLAAADASKAPRPATVQRQGGLDPS